MSVNPFHIIRTVLLANHARLWCLCTSRLRCLPQPWRSIISRSGILIKIRLLIEAVAVQRHHLPGHDGQTARYAGFAGLENGELLKQAEAAKFDVPLTVDRGFMWNRPETTSPRTPRTEEHGA